MTEAGWTRTKPTVAGWYWYKDPDYPVPTILYIQVILEPAAFWGSGVKHALKSVHGEWLGPISPTDRQQGRVAGLVRGAQLVRWHKSCAFEADPAFALERAAKDIESVASQIIQPQQAQDEKGVGDGN